MTPEIVKAVVDALFEALEQKFASRPVILMIVHTLHVAADSVIPLVVAKVQVKPGA